MQDSVEQIFYDILANQMGDIVDLDEAGGGAAANIWISSQNKTIPSNIDKLFVIIGMSDAQVISNVNSTTIVGTTQTETQQSTQRENIQIDILSRDDSARNNRYRVQMALQSVFSLQQQEKNHFKIFRIPMSFVNTSENEGGSQINRFTIVIPTHVWYRREIETIDSTNYYDNFSTRVDDEKTIDQPEGGGLIEFNLTDN